MTLEQIFAQKLTENGDKSYNTTTNPLMDLLFMSEYFQHHLDEAYIGNSEREKLFAMFMRDPRFGLGRRDLGRRLMLMAGASPAEVVKAGRFDDLFIGWEHMSDDAFAQMCDYLRYECESGNELCKKWMPRYSSKNLMLARKIAKQLGMNKQQYGHFVKCNTTENKLSRKNTEEIVFSQVPSLAMIKYFKRFANGEDTKERFAQYQEAVKAGTAELHVATTTVYDIYKNRAQIDPDLFFDKIEKISGSWIPVVDSSGSMQNSNDAYGKALSVGHYLAKCSTYAPDMVLSFSSMPQLIKLGQAYTYQMPSCWSRNVQTKHWAPNPNMSKYNNEIESMKTGDCSNTDFGALCNRLKQLDAKNAPDWIVVLSDMEWDAGSNQSAEETMKMFRANGFKTNVVWWNFNERNRTVPFRTDDFGNVFLSGYNPMLLKLLHAGFDSEMFLNAILDDYKKKIG